jgi:hypothetical protein
MLAQAQLVPGQFKHVIIVVRKTAPPTICLEDSWEPTVTPRSNPAWI